MPLDMHHDDERKRCPRCRVAKMVKHYGHSPEDHRLGTMDLCPACEHVENFQPDTGGKPDEH